MNLRVSLLLTFLLLLFQACEKPPVPLTPAQSLEQADLHFSKMQTSFALFFGSASTETMKLMRMIAMQDGSHYNNAFYFNRAIGNLMWTEGYKLFKSYDDLLEVAESADLSAHLGGAKVLKAYVLMTLVDFFGEIADPNFAPGESPLKAHADYAVEAYELAFELLEEGIMEMQLENISGEYPAVDLFYGDGSDNRLAWIAAANAIKVKWAVTMGDITALNKALTDGNSNVDQDFDLNYGKQGSSLELIHPFYKNHYLNGDNKYIANYYMWSMRGSELGSDKSVADPRLRFYFYRQTESGLNQDEMTLSCAFKKKPSHYSEETPYCLATNNSITAGNADGYWGRDHGDTNDNFSDSHLKTVYGVYPFGGRFDSNSFNDVLQSTAIGAEGRGFWPIMNSSYLDFIQAEMIISYSGDIAVARNLLESGIRKSIGKVITYTEEFETIDPDIRPTEDEINLYINQVLVNFDDSEEKYDIIAREFYLSLWGNGIEAWNIYKRTGRPSGLQLTREPNPGIPFPRILQYPSFFTNTNNQHRQIYKSFWDISGTTLN